MNFYQKRTRPTRRTVLPVVFLTAIILSAAVFSASAEFQQIQVLRIINVGTEATATILGAATSQHLSGNGTAATFDVNLGNLRARAIATGDVNGDGIPDVVVGAPEATFTVTPPGGPVQTRTGAGAAYVVLGKTALSGAIDTNAGQADVSILGAKSGDKLGFSVAVGDVNGDNIDDITMGAPGADFPGAATPPPAPRNDTGAAFVILGAASLGNPPTIDLATTNAANVALFGVNTGDQFGASVAVGNFGGLAAQTPAQQAVKDILVGAPGNNGPGSARAGAGAAYAQFGGEILNPVAGATTVFDLATTPANVVILGKTGDALGTSVATGDVNGGGAVDLIMGSALADRPAIPGVPAAADTGAVFAVFGGINLIPAVGTSKTIDIDSGQQNVSVYGADDSDHLGVSVAAGDVTGDGTPDLLAGAPDSDGPSDDRPSAGEAYVVLGGAGLNPAAGNEKRIDLFSGGATATLFGAASGDRLGSTVAAGNYNTTENSDNIPDLMAGAPGANGRAGIIAIVFGGSNLLLLPKRDVLLDQDNLRIAGQSGANNDLSDKTLRIRQTLTSGDPAATPFLQQLTAGINGNPPVVNDDTQAQFAVGTLTQVSAATTAILGDTTAPGDLELAPTPALGLDGATGSMSVPNSATLKPGLVAGWTVEFWIKRNGAGLGDFPVVIGSRPWSAPTDKGWAVALASGSTFKVSAHFADGTAGFDVTAAQSATGVTPGTWQHWAVVFDRPLNRVHFYKNGVLDNTVQSVTFPPTTVDQADDVLVGRDPGTTRVLQATLDDIRVWNVSRTAQQILDNFNKDLLGNEGNLQAYWTFNAGNGNDLTAKANNGTLGAGASIVNTADRLSSSGNRVSTFTFPAATMATMSTISWVQTAAAGTSVKIETSLDGATFQTALNGGGIPSVTLGDELGWAIATADVNNNQGEELIVGAPFANAVTGTGTRTQAGVVYILPSTAVINQSPTVTVTAPIGGETLQVGQFFTITWTASDPNGDGTIQKFDVRLSTDGGTNFNFTLAPNLPGTARQFAWSVPVGFNTAQGRIRVIVTDNQSATAQNDSAANFTITDAGVTASLTSPNGGETLKFAQQFTIAWTVPGAVAGAVKGFDLSLSTDGGLTFPIRITPLGADPAQPALGPLVRSFLWDPVPSICTSNARVAVVTTSVSNLRTSDASAANFSIGEAGPTIDTTSMFIFEDFQLFLRATAPAGGTEVLFSEGTLVQVSSDAAGTTFFSFSKPNGKIKKAGRKYVSKGTINGQDLGVFFPSGATRFIRITKPTCGITLLRVTRAGEVLSLAAPAEVEPVLQQQVWP